MNEMYLTRRDLFKIGWAAIVLSLSLPKNLLAKAEKIPVLMYHDISDQFKDEYTVSPPLFAAQMEWLYSNGYSALSFSEMGQFTQDNDKKKVIITFDDGYSSFMDYVFPLLQQYKFKAVLNIIGNYVGTYITLGGNRPMLSWDEYRYVSKSGLVDLGCHTYNLHLYRHRGVLGVPDEVLRKDLLWFQETLKHEIGKTTEILAWPYGLYSQKSIKIARGVGFKYILTSNEGYLDVRGDFHEIPRLNITDKLDLTSFRQYLQQNQK